MACNALIPRQQPTTIHGARHAGKKGTMQPIRVVIADDSSDFIEVATSCLSDVSGIEVVGCVPSGPKLLEMVKQVQADLAFVDLVMPGMNGLAVAHLLKSLEPRLKVVVMSLFDDPRLAAHVGTAGADGFIAKQYFVIELPLLLHNLFGDAVSFAQIPKQARL